MQTQSFYEKIRTEFLEPAGLINKELSEWCIINYKVDDDFDWDWHIARIVEVVAKTVFFRPRTIYGGTDYSDDETEYEILGHPYDLREVMRWLKNNNEPRLNTLCALNTIALSKPLQQQDLSELYKLMKSIS